MMASIGGHVAVVNALLKRGAQVDLQSVVRTISNHADDFSAAFYAELNTEVVLLCRVAIRNSF